MNNQQEDFDRYYNYIPTLFNANLRQVDGVGWNARADSAPLIGDEFCNHTPTPLKPLFTDHGQVNLCQVDGLGRDDRADSNTVITRSFIVRIKDVPRILGEWNSMLMNISEVSGASLSLSVDMNNVMNKTVQINVWGREEDVDEAETMILNVITEGYDDPPACLPMLHGNVHQDVKVLSLKEALHLLRENIVTIEAKSSTWIDVDASKAQKRGEAVEVDIHILGANKEDTDNAVALIKKIVSQAEPCCETKKAWDGRRGTKVERESFWSRVRSACNRMTKKC